MDEATNERIGVMVCGHGSRNVNAMKEFGQVAEGLRERFGTLADPWPVEHGYLEFADPVIAQGLDRLREKGCDHILAVPGMLFAAGHAKNDIPSVLNAYAARHDIRITYGRELGLDPKMIRAAAARIEASLESLADVPRHETLLMVVGRGASDPDANSNVSKLMRMLWEGLGFGWGEVCYSGVTFPLVEPGLEHAARLGYRRIVVFPYFLFTGVLVKRIRAFTREVAGRHPDIEFVDAPYLGAHDLVLSTFEDRVSECLTGANVMNCQMCKYREAVLGFEDQVGAVQESHHHHVEGIGGGLEGCPCNGDCDASCRDEDFCRAHGLPWRPVPAHGHAHDHDHSHGDDHSHDHHHHPYPHADHPHGPRSMEKA